MGGKKTGRAAATAAENQNKPTAPSFFFESSHTQPLTRVTVLICARSEKNRSAVMVSGFFFFFSARSRGQNG